MKNSEVYYPKLVHTWVIKTTKGLALNGLLSLFENTFLILIKHAEPLLGAVVLAAVLERSLYTSSQRYPFLQSLKVEPTGLAFAEFNKKSARLKKSEIADAFGLVLLEFFSIVDRLTGEILTPVLYSELIKRPATKKLARTSWRLHEN